MFDFISLEIQENQATIIHHGSQHQHVSRWKATMNHARLHVGLEHVPRLPIRRENVRAERAVAAIDDVVCVVGVVDDVPVASLVHPHEPVAQVKNRLRTVQTPFNGVKTLFRLWRASSCHSLSVRVCMWDIYVAQTCQKWNLWMQWQLQCLAARWSWTF